MNICPIHLNGEAMPLTEHQARELLSLRDHPGYDVFCDMLAKMQAGTRAALEDPETPLDTMRGLQGRLSVVTDVNELLSEGIPAWVTAMNKEILDV